MDIIEKLFLLKDEEYREFQARLMPTVPKERIIGVRTPALRALAKDLRRSYPEEARDFCGRLPHGYYEENSLHGFLLEQETDFDCAVEALERFLPFVDNWATCDTVMPKALKKDTERLILKVREWLSSPHTYTVRFGVNVLMKFYLKDNFKTEYADWVAALPSEEYYIMMSAAWYFATALATNYDEVLPYIEGRRLPEDTHNKAIQKATESFRISTEKKNYLKSLKIYQS